MDVTAGMEAHCGPHELFAWVEDLSRYPEWLDIVPRAVPADSHPDDPGPAWSVDLRGQLGPLARSKRLRMVRTVHEVPNLVQFERMEHDGRRHAAWLLKAEVSELSADASLLTMHLHYGGSLGGAVVEKLLADEIDRSRPRLLDKLSR